MITKPRHDLKCFRFNFVDSDWKYKLARCHQAFDTCDTGPVYPSLSFKVAHMAMHKNGDLWRTLATR